MRKLFLTGCSALALMTFSQTAFAAGTGEKGWVQERNSWKYYKTQTEASRGWLNKADNWYYLNEQTEAMETGWKHINGAWYFLDTRAGSGEGIALKGWQWIDGYCYYFVTDKNANEAKLLVNIKTPDGFTVDENGRWTENGKVQHRPGYGIITKKAAASGTKFRNGGGSGGSSGGGSSRGGSSGNSGGSNAGSSQGGSQQEGNQGGNSQGENQGNSQEGNSQGGSQGNNHGGNSQGGSQGNNHGGNSQGGDQGNNPGGNSQGGSQGSNPGGNSQGGSQGNNPGGNSQGGNQGNQGGNSQGGNQGNNPGGNSQDGQGDAEHKSVPITGISDIFTNLFGSSVYISYTGDKAKMDEYFSKIESIELNGKSLIKDDTLSPFKEAGKYSYNDGDLCVYIRDLNADNILKIRAEGYQDYVGEFAYDNGYQAPDEENKEKNPIADHHDAVTSTYISTIFAGNPTKLQDFLSDLSEVSLKLDNGEFHVLTRADVSHENTGPDRGTYAIRGYELLLNREDIEESTGVVFLDSERYKSYEFKVRMSQ